MATFRTDYVSTNAQLENPVTRKEYDILVNYTTDLSRAINELNERLEQLENPENLKL